MTTETINHQHAANAARQFVRQALDLQSLLGVLDRIASDEAYLAALPGKREAADREMQQLEERVAKSRTDSESAIAAAQETSNAKHRELQDREVALRATISSYERRETELRESISALEQQLEQLRGTARSIAGN